MTRNEIVHADAIPGGEREGPIPGALRQRVQTQPVATQRRRHHGPEQVRLPDVVHRGVGEMAEGLGLLGPGVESGDQALAPGDELVLIQR